MSGTPEIASNNQGEALAGLRRELKVDMLIQMIPDLKMLIAAHALAKSSQDNPASSQASEKQA